VSIDTGRQRRLGDVYTNLASRFRGSARAADETRSTASAR
jgi:hypothetical protein